MGFEGRGDCKHELIFVFYGKARKLPILLSEKRLINDYDTVVTLSVSFALIRQK